MHADAQVTTSRTVATISWAGVTATVTFDGVEAASSDFLLPLTLLPAMGSDDDVLSLRAAVPARVRRQAGELGHLFTLWFPDRFSPVDLTLHDARASTLAPDTSHGTAAFFSGGVDSFFTVLELSRELDAVIHVTGFDHGIGRPDEPDERVIDGAIARAADALGVELLRVRTNLRTFSDRFVLWGDHYVGSALATVAMLMADRFRLVYVPATHTYGDLFPYGTHPLVEPLWLTDSVELRLHGCDVPRPAKIARIARSQLALDTLRVCWHNPGGVYNCGRCRKCVLTAVALRSIGMLERCPTLPQRVRPRRRWKSIRIVDPSDAAFVRMARDAVREFRGPHEAEVDRILTAALARYSG